MATRLSHSWRTRLIYLDSSIFGDSKKINPTKPTSTLHGQSFTIRDQPCPCFSFVFFLFGRFLLRWPTERQGRRRQRRRHLLVVVVVDGRCAELGRNLRAPSLPPPPTWTPWPPHRGPHHYSRRSWVDVDDQGRIFFVLLNGARRLRQRRRRGRRGPSPSNQVEESSINAGERVHRRHEHFF